MDEPYDFVELAAERANLVISQVAEKKMQSVIMEGFLLQSVCRVVRYACFVLPSIYRFQQQHDE